MATIAKVKTATRGIRYKAIIRHNGRISRTKTFSTKTAARTWARRMESDIETIEATGSVGSRVTFAELGREYLEQWSGKNRSIPNKIAWWVERLGPMRLADITPRVIQQHLDDYGNGRAQRYNGAQANSQPVYRTLDRKRSPATFNRMRALISAVFKFAIGRHYLAANPVKSIPSKTENNQRITNLPAIVPLKWLLSDYCGG